MSTTTRFRLGGISYTVFSEAAASGHRPVLTRAEQDVLALVLAGHGNAAIASARGTSVRTVANQIASLFKKYGVGSRAQLAARWQT